MEVNQKDLFGSYWKEGNDYIVATALQSELPNSQLNRVLLTGVGKINAAHALTRFLERNPQVRTVINYGTAGAAYGVTKGDLIRCTTFVQGDMDCSLITDGPGVTFADSDKFSNVLNFVSASSSDFSSMSIAPVLVVVFLLNDLSIRAMVSFCLVI